MLLVLQSLWSCVSSLCAVVVFMAEHWCSMLYVADCLKLGTPAPMELYSTHPADLLCG